MNKKQLKVFMYLIWKGPKFPKGRCSGYPLKVLEHAIKTNKKNIYKWIYL